MAGGAAALVVAVVLLGDRGGGGDRVEEGPAVPRSEFYGVNAPRLRALSTEARRETLDAHAREIAERGIGWARVVFDQPIEQPAPGQTDWAIPDQFVAALAREGVRTAAVFVGTARWAAPDADPACARAPMVPPADIEAWADFLGEAAARYGPGGDFWRQNPDLPELAIRAFEVGNEPNTRLFWCPAANPEQYAAVYAAAHDAIVRANPEARPVVAGLAPAFFLPAEGSVTVQEFLRRMLAAVPGLADEIEAVAIHPYGPTPEHVLQSVRAFRAVLREVGLGRTPMIANETGWHTRGPPGTRFADEETRPRFIAEVASVIDRTDCGIEGFAIHAWLTPERDSDRATDWYGIADPQTGAPKESAVAYGRAIAGESPAGRGPLTRTASNLCSRLAQSGDPR
ncbi:MAG: hypothetical protein ACRDKH_05175 [Solirubrobacterales bacterium]